MGLIVNIYRSDYDCELNVFAGYKAITVVNIEGPFEPCADRPAAILKGNAFGNPIIVPAAEVREGYTPYMDGGTFAATSDSRFTRATGLYAGIPIHDRTEPWNTRTRLTV